MKTYAELNSDSFPSPGAAAANPLVNAFAALDRKDYATAKWLFQAVGRNEAAEAIENALAALDRKDYATADGLFEALVPTKLTAYRQPLHQKEKAKRRGLRRLLLVIGLALFTTLGLYAYGSQLSWALVSAKSQAIAGLASVVDVIKAPLEGIAGREEQHAEVRDLSAALTQVTTRLDQIEREHGARLDKFGERLDQNSSASAAAAAAPPPPISEFADVVARLDKLEKGVAGLAAPPSELADITTRLDKLEKRAAASAVGSVKPPPTTSRQSTPMARAEPSASNQVAKPDRPLLRDYSVESVQDGIAVVHSRHGPQQVTPGDIIPGAGRVVRIERRGGEWLVLTSLGVIASGQNESSQQKNENSQGK